jgi:cell wall-associated NlpC family hydrolase
MNPMVLVAGAVAVVALPVAGLMFLSGGSTAAHAAACGEAVTQSPLGVLTAEQTANATVIVDVGENMAVPSYGQVIAIATALQESDLHNLTSGDADSLGLFQQRPSQGWGSPAQILDPSYAATAFYQHLLAVPGWESLPLTQAAQAVQHSAFPDAYAQWQAEATSTVQYIAGGTVVAAPISSAPTAGGTAVQLDPSANSQVCGVTDLPPSLVGQVLTFAAAQVGKPYVLGATGPDAWDCSALVQAAYAAVGAALPRTADEQYDYTRAHGQILTGPPSADALQPGDLLFSPGDDPVPAADGASIGHVAIYAGNGVVIEAKGAAWGVIATTYTAADFSQVSFVGRLIGPPISAAPTTSGVGSSALTAASH